PCYRSLGGLIPRSLSFCSLGILPKSSHSPPTQTVPDGTHSALEEATACCQPAVHGRDAHATEVWVARFWAACPFVAWASCPSRVTHRPPRPSLTGLIQLSKRRLRAASLPSMGETPMLQKFGSSMGETPPPE